MKTSVILTILCLTVLLAPWLLAGPITNPPPSVTLSWSPSPGTNVITNYSVWWSEVAGTNWITYMNHVDAGTNLTAIVTNLIRGNTYWFIAEAQDTSGLASLPSNQVSTNTPSPPPAPTALTIQGSQ